MDCVVSAKKHINNFSIQKNSHALTGLFLSLFKLRPQEFCAQYSQGRKRW